MFRPEVHGYPTLGFKLKTQGCVFKRLHDNAEVYFNKKVEPNQDDLKFLQNIEEYRFRPKIHTSPPRKALPAPLAVEINMGSEKYVLSLERDANIARVVANFATEHCLEAAARQQLKI